MSTLLLVQYLFILVFLESLTIMLRNRDILGLKLLFFIGTLLILFGCSYLLPYIFGEVTSNIHMSIGEFNLTWPSFEGFILILNISILISLMNMNILIYLNFFFFLLVYHITFRNMFVKSKYFKFYFIKVKNYKYLFMYNLV